MQDNSTPSSASADSPILPIIIDCLLYDSVAGHPIRCADVVLVGDGVEVEATTDPDGYIRFLVESEAPSQWQDLEVPHEGTWTIHPNTKKFDTHYFFLPKEFDVPNHKQVDVEGEYRKNVQQLATYVENVLLAGRDIFMAEMRRDPSVPATEEKVIKATKNMFDIVSKGLAFIVDDRPEQPSSEEGLNSQLIDYLCERLRDSVAPRDKIPCSLCYTRYSTNQARLQTCLCCEPCIP